MMKTFLALVGVLLLTIGIVGYFRGWYDVNTPRITEDLNTGKEKVQGLFSSKEKDAPPGVAPQKDNP